jgi:hypothetical protein
MFLGMRQGRLAFWTIRDYLGTTFAAKFGGARAIKTVIAARTQAIQSYSHLFLLDGLLGPLSYTPGNTKNNTSAAAIPR